MAQQAIEATRDVAQSLYTPGRLHSVETMGPGIRFVIFTQGCPMRCAYCHNPDTWEVKAGTLISVEQLADEFESKRGFYKNGGVTVTGGEPLLQPDFLADLFTVLHGKIRRASGTRSHLPRQLRLRLRPCASREVRPCARRDRPRVARHQARRPRGPQEAHRP